MSRSGGQVLLYSQREKSSEELKSKGRRERERQWVSKVKGSSVFQNISGNGQVFGRRVLISSFCCSCSQVGRVRSSLYELNKGPSQSGRGAGSSEAGPHGIITKTMKSKSKKQFSTGSQNWPSSLQQSHVLVTYYQVPSLKKARFQVWETLCRSYDLRLMVSKLWPVGRVLPMA